MDQTECNSKQRSCEQLEKKEQNKKTKKLEATKREDLRFKRCKTY